jgi:endogenous inhibitor of DNA gyrase (YacG/DUF329 family)
MTGRDPATTDYGRNLPVFVPEIPMKCPTCEKELDYSFQNPFRPFCSERCKLIDLGKWAAEQYRVPTAEKPGEAVHRPDDQDED